MIEEALVAAGYEVLGPVSNYRDAVRLALRGTPHLVLMDIRLAGDMDGVAAATEIWLRTGIRSLFASAHFDFATIHRAQRAHPAGWLLKPYSVDELLRATAKIVDRLPDSTVGE
jgi:DNA-binding NarL/FixJ family response regulator